MAVFLFMSFEKYPLHSALFLQNRNRGDTTIRERSYGNIYRYNSRYKSQIQTPGKQKK